MLELALYFNPEYELVRIVLRYPFAESVSSSISFLQCRLAVDHLDKASSGNSFLRTLEREIDFDAEDSVLLPEEVLAILMSEDRFLVVDQLIDLVSGA